MHAPFILNCIVFSTQDTVIRFFRCKNIFVQRKCTEIFYSNIILKRKFSDEYLGQVRTYSSGRLRLLYVTVQRIEPPLRKNREHTFEIFLGKCPMTVSCFSTATAYLSHMLVGFLPHTSSSAAHIFLYTW